MEKILLDAAGYRIAEDIRYYRQLGGPEKRARQITTADLHVQLVYSK